MYQCKIIVHQVISTISDKYIFIFFYPVDHENNNLLIVKVTMESSCNPNIEYEVTLPDMRAFKYIIGCKKDIYFFAISGYCTLGIDNKASNIDLKRYQFSDPLCFDSYLILLDYPEPYCEFQGKIYSLKCMDKSLHLYELNQVDSEWDLLSVQPVEFDVEFIKSISSPMDLLFILDVEYSNHESDDESENEDLGKVIYCYDLNERNLVLWKDSGVHSGQYLLAPAHLFD